MEFPQKVRAEISAAEGPMGLAIRCDDELPPGYEATPQICQFNGSLLQLWHYAPCPTSAPCKPFWRPVPHFITEGYRP